MRSLLVTTHTPVLRSGQAVRTYGVARALAQQGKLDLLYVRFGAGEPDANFKAIPGIELHEVVPSRGLTRLLTYGAARLGGVPAGVARGISRELGTRAEQLADLDNTDARAGKDSRHAGTQAADDLRVIADGPVAAAALARLARRRPVIYNAHNFESGFRHELEGSRAEKASALRKFERGVLARASESWMVSQADLAAAHELCPQARLRYAPNVVDVAAIAPVQPVEGSQSAIFVASFVYEPNRNGLDFLLAEVFPLVWAELPEAKLMLVGAGLEQPPSTDPRVQTLGFVDDLADVYARASCAVIPLLQGGGTPLKFVEALAYGLPIVATPRAAAGLEVRDGADCLIAEGAEGFAAALVRIMRDGAPELGRQGRRLALERYSIEALSAQLSA